jgi:hypothetical protein
VAEFNVTPWSRIRFEKLTVAEHASTFLPLTEPCSQETGTDSSSATHGCESLKSCKILVVFLFQFAVCLAFLMLAILNGQQG